MLVQTRVYQAECAHVINASNDNLESNVTFDPIKRTGSPKKNQPPKTKWASEVTLLAKSIVL